MGMFDNYDNLQYDYEGNNITNNPPTEYKIIDTSVPARIFDIKGNFVGYQWQQGETFNLIISANSIINVKEDSIVYNETGEGPDDGTFGYPGQQAYNTADSISWTCEGLEKGLFIWTQDPMVIYDAHGTKEIELDLDMTDKILQFDIVNFRGDVIRSFATTDSTLIVDIDNDLSSILKGSVYSGFVTINTEKGPYQKDRFSLSVM